jgi:hypothetical protein
MGSNAKRRPLTNRNSFALTRLSESATLQRWGWSGFGLLPGTELAFEDDIQYDRAFSLFGKARVNHKVARFRQVNMNDANVHHDALEFPDGLIVKVTRLVEGQTATVLQLPAAMQHQDRKSMSQMSTGTIEA